MKDLFNALALAEKAVLTAQDLEGRSFGVSVAIVADVDDPLKLGRIRVALPAKGTKTLSDWLTRLTPSKLISVPLVNVGDTVVVSFINGNPNDGIYLGALNNIPQPPSVDMTQTVSINKNNSIVQTETAIQMAVVNSQVVLTEDVAQVTNGNSAVIINKDSIHLVTGSTTFKLTSNGSLDISGVSSVTINGKQVATLGARDTRGDSLVGRGW